jgi:DNA-binding NarL/FixJ family response regulator
LAKTSAENGEGYDARRPLPEQVRALRATGLSMAAIAEQLHCAPSTVHRHLHTAR